MNSKRKGNNGEREVLHLLQENGFQAHRNDQRYVGGVGLPDVGAVIGGKLFHLEIKRVENLSIWSALAQAERDAREMLPMVCFRRNRGHWYCALPLEDFLSMQKSHQRKADSKDGKLIISHDGSVCNGENEEVPFRD